MDEIRMYYTLNKLLINYKNRLKEIENSMKKDYEEYREILSRAVIIQDEILIMELEAFLEGYDEVNLYCED